MHKKCETEYLDDNYVDLNICVFQLFRFRETLADLPFFPFKINRKQLCAGKTVPNKRGGCQGGGYILPGATSYNDLDQHLLYSALPLIN